MTTTIHLVRHGEVHNPDDIYYGRIPGYRLSERGREQAAAAGKFLAKRRLAAIYASPQQRAQETAEKCWVLVRHGRGDLKRNLIIKIKRGGLRRCALRQRQTRSYVEIQDVFAAHEQNLTSLAGI